MDYTVDYLPKKKKYIRVKTITEGEKIYPSDIEMKKA